MARNQPLDNIALGLNMEAERGWRGATYRLYSGRYGNYQDVLVKVTPRVENPLVRSDIMFSQILAHTGRVQRLIATEKSGNNFYLAVEEYEMGADEILKDWAGEAGRFDIKQVLRSLLEAVQSVHGSRILHGDLRTKNIGIKSVNGEIVGVSWLCHRNNRVNFILGKAHVVLKGFKYSRFMSSPPTLEAPVREFFLGDAALYNYKRELETLAGVLYLFYKKTYEGEVSPYFRLDPDFGAERTADYNQVHLKHLISMMLEDSALPRRSVSINDYLTHPYFRTPAELTEFETRMWSLTSAMRRSANDWLDATSPDVFTSLWTDHVPDEVWNVMGPGGTALNPLSMEDRMRLTRLWNTRRNRRLHRDEDSLGLRQLIGRLPADNFNFWEQRFPYFTLNLFRRMATYRAPGSPFRVCEDPEFRSYYSASPDFYILCDRVTMIGGGDGPNNRMGRPLEWP